MWPWGHAAVGYLLYVAYRRLRDGTSPTGPAVLALGFGTQLPDLVDKPLAWTFGVLTSGRSLAHSWLVAGLVLVAAWRVVDERHRPLVGALAVGWLSHGLGDAFYSVLTWEPAYLGFLLWPVTSTPPYDTERSFLAHFAGMEFTPYVLLQFGLAALAVVVWDRDGRPGLGTLRSALDWTAALRSS